jgi:Tfp pilus assembly protein PilN
MARKHRFSIVVMLGAAVVAGFFALSRSVQLGAASKPASTAQISARARSLDRLEAQLRRQLAALPKAAPKAQQVATRSASPGVLYDRSTAPVMAPHGDDDEHSAEGHDGNLGEADGDD